MIAETEKAAPPAEMPARFTPTVGDGSVLPVEILPLDAKEGEASALRWTVTGDSIQLAPGRYLVQVGLPSGSALTTTPASQVTVAAGEDVEVALDDLIAQGWQALEAAKAYREAIAESGRVALDGLQRTGQAFLDAARKAAPHVGDGPLSAAKAALEAVQANQPILPAVQALTRAALSSPGLRSAFGAALGAASSRWASLRDAASSQPAATVSGDKAMPGVEAPATAGEGAPQAPDAPAATVDQIAFVGLKAWGPDEVLASWRRSGEGDGGDAGETLAIGGAPWQAHVRGHTGLVAIRGPGFRALCFVPCDASLTDGTLAEVSVPATPSGGVLYPQTTLLFSDPALNALWAFVSTNDFENARRIAAAQARHAAASAPQADSSLPLVRLALGGYVLLRANLVDALAQTVEALDASGTDDPDALVIRAECAARSGRHGEAIGHLKALGTRCPALRLGVTYALQRTRAYRRLDASREVDDFQLDESGRTMLDVVETNLSSAAACMDVEQLNLVLSECFGSLGSPG